MAANRASRIVDWLLAGSKALEAEALLEQLADRLDAAGLPILRSATSLPAMHPEVFVKNLVWVRGEGSRSTERHHDLTSMPMYRDSPVAAIHRGEDEIVCRLDVPESELPFPTIAEYARAGGTGYSIVALPFSDGRRTFFSWTTARPGGFGADDLALLRALVPALSLRLELASWRLSTRSLLHVYLGRDAAERVLAGAFKRGTGETVQAAIWFCDLRGFTEMGDRRPVAEVVKTLDRYFECVAGPVVDGGGEILKFVGDAMLAIFPLGARSAAEPFHDGPASGPRSRAAAEPCGRALVAAEAALAELGTLNERLAAEGDAPLAIGVALHYGEVMYGNIGARGRLDFTVIGAPVNEVCRVEALCRPLGRPLLCTATFAATLGASSLVSLGYHALKGVSEPAEIFAPGVQRRAL